jgi:CheY-like chemotaxis protein
VSATLGRVLIVEDEVMIALMLESLLLELGYEVAGCAHRLDKAIEIARTYEIHIALLDLNLNGQSSLPVADILHDRGIPFVFATGYGRAGLKGKFPAAPVLTKPFKLENLAEALVHARTEQAGPYPSIRPADGAPAAAGA